MLNKSKASCINKCAPLVPHLSHQYHRENSSCRCASFTDKWIAVLRTWIQNGVGSWFWDLYHNINYIYSIHDDFFFLISLSRLAYTYIDRNPVCSDRIRKGEKTGTLERGETRKAAINYSISRTPVTVRYPLNRSQDQSGERNKSIIQSTTIKTGSKVIHRNKLRIKRPWSSVKFASWMRTDKRREMWRIRWHYPLLLTLKAGTMSNNDELVILGDMVA